MLKKLKEFAKYRLDELSNWFFSLKGFKFLYRSQVFFNAVIAYCAIKDAFDKYYFGIALNLLVLFLGFMNARKMRNSINEMEERANEKA